MYPQNYFGLFPPFPREDKVFVAMSFDTSLRSRWEKVIAPGIHGVQVNGVALEPHRVDTSRISDSILTEILDGVSRSRLVLADVTALGSASGGGAVPNGNVMYEVGLAHAIRLPEEVLLFRSDSGKILFDIANVRVNLYDPDSDPQGARDQVGNAIVESIKEVDLKRHLAVRRAAETLDLTGWLVLLDAQENSGIQHFRTKSVAEALSNGPRNEAIARLLEVGALATDYQALTPTLIKDSKDYREDFRRIMKYTLTPFGMALISYVVQRMTKDGTPEIANALLVARIKELLLDAQKPTTLTDAEPATARRRPPNA